MPAPSGGTSAELRSAGDGCDEPAEGFWIALPDPDIALANQQGQGCCRHVYLFTSATGFYRHGRRCVKDSFAGHG